MPRPAVPGAPASGVRYPGARNLSVRLAPLLHAELVLLARAQLDAEGGQQTLQGLVLDALEDVVRAAEQRDPTLRPRARGTLAGQRVA